MTSDTNADFNTTTYIGHVSLETDKNVDRASSSKNEITKGKGTTIGGRLFYRIYGKAWSDMSNEEKKVIVCKALLVAAVISGLIVASVFTGGAAAVAVAAGHKTIAAVLVCTSIGLGISTVSFVPVAAYRAKMFAYTKHNLRDAVAFLVCSIASTALTTGVLAASGGFIIGVGSVPAGIGYGWPGVSGAMATGIAAFCSGGIAYCAGPRPDPDRAFDDYMDRYFKPTSKH